LELSFKEGFAATFNKESLLVEYKFPPTKIKIKIIALINFKLTDLKTKNRKKIAELTLK
jgi:hypothetical protein